MEWCKKATGDIKISTTSASRRLTQMIGEEQMNRLDKDPSRTHGRCFIWTGKDADPLSRNILNDLQDRIDLERGSRYGGGSAPW